MSDKDDKLINLQERFRRATEGGGTEDNTPPLVGDGDGEEGEDPYYLYAFVTKDNECVEAYGRLVVTPVFVLVTQGNQEVVFGANFDHIKYFEREDAETPDEAEEA